MLSDANPDAYPYDLGIFHCDISTKSVTAQQWFNRGLIWSYAFHHEEAVRCFEKVIAVDETCAMGYWGLAFALGPNYNKPWDLFDSTELQSTIIRINTANARAAQHASTSTSSDLEKALITAVQLRVPNGISESAFRTCNEAYADAMAAVYARFPADLDIVALFADALMNLSAWDLWDLTTGAPRPGARSLEAKTVLEKALEQDGAKRHPGVLHQYVHLMEMSANPETALPAADCLRALIPDAGHLVHMPSHLDILVGDYAAAIAANEDACRADEKYLAEYGGDNFYSFYRMHNYHSLIYAAMFAGQKRIALDAVERLEASLPESLLRIESPPMADWLENFASVRVHVLVRFGLWDDLLALPMPGDQELYCVTTAMLHYGKGVAAAVTGDISTAAHHLHSLEAAIPSIPASRICGDFPNRSNTVLLIGQSMLAGELAYRQRNYALAFSHLEVAITRDDALTYAEPWPWMQPTRHAYAALLLEQGRIEDAATAYRADLGLDETLPRARRHPGNVWALHGYRESMEKLGKKEEEEDVAEELRRRLKGADVEITASCCCRGALGE